MYNFEEVPPCEKTKRDKRILILGIMFTLMCISLWFTGCASNKQERLECVDGHLYSVSPQKVELMLQDSCDKGRISLR